MAWITAKWAQGRGTFANRNIMPPGYRAQNPQLARGHLWGRQNGGSGDEPRNLVTLLHVPTNTPKMRDQETAVRTASESGKTICGAVIPIYLPGRNVPAAIAMFVVDSDGNQVVRKIIANPPGIEP
jgi:hypothetical protein